MSITGKGGRPIGLPKTGGRKTGTPNKSTAILRDELAQLHFSPGRVLVSIAENPKTAVDLRIQICAILMPYMYAKLKPAEESTERGVILKPTTILEDFHQKKQEESWNADDQHDPET
jgi:hypothetical protein